MQVKTEFQKIKQLLKININYLLNFNKPFDTYIFSAITFAVESLFEDLGKRLSENETKLLKGWLIWLNDISREYIKNNINQEDVMDELKFIYLQINTNE